MNDIVDILNKAGYKIVVGKEAVLEAISSVADNNTTLLCSGYKVFPDGTKCNGCPDCEDIENV